MSTPSNPGWDTGYVPTAAQWTAAFSGKVDYPAPFGQGGTGLTATPAVGNILIGTGSGFMLHPLEAGPGISIGVSPGRIQISSAAVVPSSSVTISVVASAPIIAGQFVNIYASGGETLARPAEANSPDTFANSFALVDTATSAFGQFQFMGLNALVDVLPEDGGSVVWLSDTVAGSYTSTVPTASGHIIQPLGIAYPGVGIVFTTQPTVLL